MSESTSKPMGLRRTMSDLFVTIQKWFMIIVILDSTGDDGITIRIAHIITHTNTKVIIVIIINNATFL